MIIYSIISILSKSQLNEDFFEIYQKKLIELDAFVNENDNYKVKNS